MFSVEPDIPSIKGFTDITPTSVKVSWSVGQTNVVNTTVLRYRVTSGQWTPVSVTGTSHTVTSLQPGTEYQFYVTITSYGKSSSSSHLSASTGKDVVFLFFLTCNLIIT